MIKINNLTKNFDGYVALRDFSMSVKPGSIYGLVGVNGSGKTTAIKHIAGVFQGDGGTVRIGEVDVYDNEKIKEQVGYVPDELYFFPHYNLKMLRKFHAKTYAKWNDERFAELLALMGLDLNRRVGRFSKGMQKQAALALSLSIMPEVLLLDEPIDGLDPIVRKKIFEWIIEDVAERKMTVLVSSHNLKEMDGICDTVGIIKDGQMLLERDLDELKTEMAGNPSFAHQPPSLDEIFIYVYEAEGEPGPPGENILAFKQDDTREAANV